MRGTRTRIVSFAAAALAVLTVGVACGGEEHGVCDRSQVADVHRCTEATGDGAEDSAGACVDMGGVWTDTVCPDADLIGCCSYTLFDIDFRDCWYPDAARTFDPESQCTSTTFNDVPGVWEDASP